MFHLLRSLSLMVGVAILVSCGHTSTALNVPVRKGPSVQAPAYQQGDSWVFKVVREGSPEEEDCVSFRNGKFESSNLDFFDGAIWTTVYRAKDDLKPLDFPLTPGKTWRYTYSGTNSRGRTSWREAEVKVIGPTARPMETAAGGNLKSSRFNDSKPWAMRHAK